MITRRERLPEPSPAGGRGGCNPPAAEDEPAPPPAPVVSPRASEPGASAAFDLVPRRIAERERGVARSEPAPPPGEPGTGEIPLSVGEVVARVRDLLEGHFRCAILVEGEVSNARRARGGHLYFTLKDQRAQLKVVV
ncbi:exodeoxyribonuclease VII large subunit, partial [bacterium]|nr:exodeoxyribonuclease VII large subunit [bacterium]